MAESAAMGSELMPTAIHPNDNSNERRDISPLRCDVFTGGVCINGSTRSTVTGVSEAASQLPNINPTGQPPNTSSDSSIAPAPAPALAPTPAPTTLTSSTSSVIAVTSSLLPHPSPASSFLAIATTASDPTSTEETSISAKGSAVIPSGTSAPPSNGTRSTEPISQTPPTAFVLTSHNSSTYAPQTMPPLPGGSTTSPVVPQGRPLSIPPASGAVTSSNQHSNHTGAIVGGVIGGLAFLLLATAAAILLYRRMRARRTAPSAEFIDIMRGTTPGPVPASGAKRAEGTTTPSGDRLLGLEDGDDERPPAFIPGVYGDPVFEKVQAAAAMREQYQRRDSYAVAWQADYKEELGDSEVGHDDESTEVGTEEGYGLDGDEKAGYTWAI